MNPSKTKPRYDCQEEARLCNEIMSAVLDKPQRVAQPRGGVALLRAADAAATPGIIAAETEKLARAFEVRIAMHASEAQTALQCMRDAKQHHSLHFSASAPHVVRCAEELPPLRTELQDLCHKARRILGQVCPPPPPPNPDPMSSSTEG